MSQNKNSQARIKANNRYNAKTYDRISIAVPKGHKAAIQAHAQSRNETVNGFICRAVAETLEREGAPLDTEPGEP